MTSEGVVEKARAAVAWCERATRLTAEGGGKPWGYLPIRFVPREVYTCSPPALHV